MKKSKLSILQQKMSLIVAILFLSTFATEAADTSNLEEATVMDLARLASARRDSKAEMSHELLARNPLFGEEEWGELQMGLSIIHDRIRQKQETLTYLKSDRPLGDKQIYCVRDFGTVPIARSDASDERAGISGYCAYTSFILNTYNAMRTLGQSLANARSMEEKNHYQNLLYYLLSYQEKAFQAVVKPFTHTIPEHSQENTFYDILLLKMCANATKEYAFLNEYIIVSSEVAGIRKQIDNAKLYDHYKKTHKDMITALKSHPVFWMHLLADSDIKELVGKQTAIIEKGLSECVDEVLAATEYLKAKIRTFDDSGRTTEIAIYHLYQEFGPVVLETIRRYEAITDRIKQIEKAAITWLKALKATESQNNKGNLFKKIPTEQRGVIRGYLQEQNAKEAAMKREADRAAAEAIAALRAQKKLEKDKIRAKKLAAKALAAALTKSEGDETAEEIITNPTKILPTISTALGTAAIASYTTADPVMGYDGSSSSMGDPWPAQPKVKIKTRQPQEASGAATSVIEKSDDGTQKFMLPPQLRTAEFEAFIRSLTNETNERILKQQVTRLNKDYGIFFETDEKKNKGYFAVRSPITEQLHVRTYHHLHQDNPYGSIFMALRDVLQAADLR